MRECAHEEVSFCPIENKGTNCGIVIAVFEVIAVSMIGCLPFKEQQHQLEKMTRPLLT